MSEQHWHWRGLSVRLTRRQFDPAERAVTLEDREFAATYDFRSVIEAERKKGPPATD